MSRLGLNCEFCQPCSSLEIDIRREGFLSDREWSGQYNILRVGNEVIQVYDRPVYYNEKEPKSYDIIIFLGRRWVLFDHSFQTQDDLQKSLEGFHPEFSNSNFTAAFVSEPVDVNTPNDIATPIGLDWFHVRVNENKLLRGMQSADLTRPSSAVLLCAVCDNDTNPCLYDGECVNETCQCSVGSSGGLCQIPPIGNDPFFNTPEFNYDGGDCCESTCVSGAYHKCGKDETGYVDIGYTNCTENTNRWRLNSKPVSALSSFARSGTSVDLPGIGRVLAVGEPGANTVRLFGKDGSEWIQLGTPLEGPTLSDFGWSIAISRVPASNIAGLNSLFPLVLAVGGAFMSAWCRDVNELGMTCWGMAGLSIILAGLWQYPAMVTSWPSPVHLKP